MLPFVAVFIQMRHDVHASVEGCWLVTEYFLTPLHSTAVRCDWFLHIPHFLQFANNDTAVAINDQNCGRLWEKQHVIESLNSGWLKYFTTNCA
jgi:hypothetical protein